MQTIKVTTQVFSALLEAGLLVPIVATEGTPWTTWGYEDDEDDMITCTLIAGEQVVPVAQAANPA